MNLHTMHLVPTGQTQATKYLFASPENQTLPEAPHLWIYHAHKAQIPKLYFFLVLISWYVLQKCRKIMALIFKDTTRSHRTDKREQKDAIANWCESSFLLLYFISMYIVYYIRNLT